MDEDQVKDYIALTSDEEVVKELNQEFQELLTQKRKDYSEYHDAKEKMQLYKTAKYDINRILNQDIEKELERSARREHSQSR